MRTVTPTKSTNPGVWPVGPVGHKHIHTFFGLKPGEVSSFFLGLILVLFVRVASTLVTRGACPFFFGLRSLKSDTTCPIPASG